MAFLKKRLYMDFASATPLHPHVARAYARALKEYGNPSAVHHEGRRARALVSRARERIARTLSVKPESIIFTGSGTESNNLALMGVVEAVHVSGIPYTDMHIVVSSFEHPSIERPIEALEGRGVSVSRVSPNKEGIITPESILEVVTARTVLVSVCAVQGEIGVVQPIRDIAHLLSGARKKSSRHTLPHVPFPLLHSDASQAFLFTDGVPEKLGADLLTYDAQKIMGPKGVGILYRRSYVPLTPVIRGGSQERSVRPGTENTPAIVAMGEAFHIAHTKRAKRAKRAKQVQDNFFSLLKKEIPSARVTGSLKKRVPNNVHITLPDVDGDYLAVLLDKEGIAVSPRSACVASGEISTPTAVVVGEGAAHSTLRLTFGPSTSLRDSLHAVRALKKVLPLATSIKK